MHILIIPSEHLVTEQAPLAGIFQYEQAQALAQAGNKVGVLSVGFITLRYLFKDYSYQKKQEEENLVIVRDYKQMFFPHRYYSTNFLKRKYIALFLSKFNEYVKENGMPDVVHAHNFLFAGFIAEEVRNKFNIPFIVTEHSSSFARGLVPDNLNIDLKSICTNASSVSCVSIKFKNILQERLSNCFEVLHNIVDQTFFDEPLSRDKYSKLTFINVASLDNNKNQSFLLDAFACKFKKKDVQLNIVGDGPLKAKLIEQVKKLGIEQQVHFLGRLTRNQVRDEMLKSHCFVLPSKYETFGVVLIEALACGLPLIATKCGGPEDIVNDTNGYLVDVNNQEQLQHALQKIFFLYANNENYIYNPELLRQEALYKFGEKAFVERATKFYKKAVNSKNTEKQS